MQLGSQNMVACNPRTQPTGWAKKSLSEKDMTPYSIPNDSDFVPESLFAAAFRPWNSYDNMREAKKLGFSYEEGKARTGVWDFADLDCDFISLHHHFKWFKFGMSRTFDNVLIMFRYGDLIRDQAINILREARPEQLDDDIAAFCNFVGKPVSWYWDLADRFRNLELWEKQDGIWKIPGFLLPDWDWEALSGSRP